MLINKSRLNKNDSQYYKKKIYFILYFKKNQAKKEMATQLKNNFKSENALPGNI